MLIPPSAIFRLQEPPERQASLSTYSTSSHEYASVRPAPATPPSHLPVPSLAWASRSICRSGPPTEAASTQSNGAGPLSCSVQRAVEMPAARASCGCPSVRIQLQVVLPDEGWGRFRSGEPGERTCTAWHACAVDESQATLLPSCAVASIGPFGLFRRVCAVGDPAAAAP